MDKILSWVKDKQVIEADIVVIIADGLYTQWSKSTSPEDCLLQLTEDAQGNFPAGRQTSLTNFPNELRLLNWFYVRNSSLNKPLRRL